MNFQIEYSLAIIMECKKCKENFSSLTGLTQHNLSTHISDICINIDYGINKLFLRTGMGKFVCPTCFTICNGFEEISLHLYCEIKEFDSEAERQKPTVNDGKRTLTEPAEINYQFIFTNEAAKKDLTADTANSSKNEKFSSKRTISLATRDETLVEKDLISHDESELRHALETLYNDKQVKILIERLKKIVPETFNPLNLVRMTDLKRNIPPSLMKDGKWEKLMDLLISGEFISYVIKNRRIGYLKRNF